MCICVSPELLAAPAVGAYWISCGKATALTLPVIQLHTPLPKCLGDKVLWEGLSRAFWAEGCCHALPFTCSRNHIVQMTAGLLLSPRVHHEQVVERNDSIANLALL